jgi:hypothetical protein
MSSEEDPERGRTRLQQEWADWASHGYRKMYQPRSMLWAGGIFFLFFGGGLIAVVWLAVSGLL